MALAVLCIIGFIAYSAIVSRLVFPKLQLRTFRMLCIAVTLISLTGCGQVTSSSGAGGSNSATATNPITIARQPAASTFFGLTVLNYQNVTPQLTFGTTRTLERPIQLWTGLR